MKNRIFLYLKVLPIAAIIVLLYPFLSFFNALPSEESLKPGEDFSNTFSRFDNKYPRAKIGNNEFTDEMICLSCIPYKEKSKECVGFLSSYITKKIIKNPGNMILWHLYSRYLNYAIQAKYSEKAIYNIYFSIFAGHFDHDNIGQFCTQKFGKECKDLTPDDLITLQKSFNSGVFPPKDFGNNEIFSPCIDKKEQNK